jgi:hypothetical protein
MERVFKKIGELLGPNWRDEVLGTLGPEYAMFAALPQYGVVPDVGVLLKVGDRTKVEAAIAKGLAQLPKKEAHRSLKYGDATIEYLDLGQLEIDDDVKLRPAWTFVDGYLLVTLSPHSAKSVLVAMTQTGGGLPGREDFARAFGRLKSESPNAGNLGIGYLDFPWLAGFVLDSAIPIIQSAVGPDDLAELGPVELDLAKLPATQAIVKHLQPIVFQNQTKDGGLYGEFISPTSVVGTLVAGAGVAATLFIGEMATSPPEPVSAPGTRPIPGDEDEDR